MTLIRLLITMLSKSSGSGHISVPRQAYQKCLGKSKPSRLAAGGRLSRYDRMGISNWLSRHVRYVEGDDFENCEILSFKNLNIKHIQYFRSTTIAYLGGTITSALYRIKLIICDDFENIPTT